MRRKKYFYGIICSIISQIVIIVSGIILPKIFIAKYGSEIYGATTSISQFLGYIAILEGGIGGVARAALYKPLAEKDQDELNRVVSYIKYFFRIIAYIFIVYTFIIACFYKCIAKSTSLDWFASFSLVIVISLSSLAQYYFGIAYMVLLQADQKKYVSDFLNALTLAVNTVTTCALASKGYNIVIVKLVWCFGHVIRIAILNYYIKRCYNIVNISSEKNCLPQKWDGFGQHIAFFLHGHTDIIVLTLFVNLYEVSVYSVYSYIVSSISILVLLVGTNMESIFGDMIARNEKRELAELFDLMDFLINSCSIICFSVSFGTIVPFVKLYIVGVDDINYYRYLLAYLMLLTQVVYCIRQPYQQLIIAAGHFKETKKAAYIEAGLNIILSCILCIRFKTEGVVIATLVSMVYKWIYYVFYIHKNIIFRNMFKSVKRSIVTITNMAINVILFSILQECIGEIRNYLKWFITAFIFFIAAAIITGIISLLFYRKEFNLILKKIKRIITTIV